VITTGFLLFCFLFFIPSFFLFPLFIVLMPSLIHCPNALIYAFLLSYKEHCKK